MIALLDVKISLNCGRFVIILDKSRIVQHSPNGNVQNNLKIKEQLSDLNWSFSGSSEVICKCSSMIFKNNPVLRVYIQLCNVCVSQKRIVQAKKPDKKKRTEWSQWAIKGHRFGCCKARCFVQENGFGDHPLITYAVVWIF